MCDQRYRYYAQCGYYYAYNYARYLAALTREG
jgi:hypothetical protein